MTDSNTIHAGQCPTCDNLVQMIDPRYAEETETVQADGVVYRKLDLRSEVSAKALERLAEDFANTPEDATDEYSAALDDLGRDGDVHGALKDIAQLWRNDPAATSKPLPMTKLQLERGFMELAHRDAVSALQLATGLFVGISTAYVDLRGEKGDGKKEIKMEGSEVQREITIHALGYQAEASPIQKLQTAIAAWSDAQFGTDRPPSAPLHHLAKEVIELIESPTDRMEYADCLMLILDAYRMNGGTADDLVLACGEKLEINNQREWGEPDEHGVVEHIRN